MGKAARRMEGLRDIAGCGQEDAARAADVQNDFAPALRRVSVAGQGMPSLLFPRQRCR